MNFAQEVGKQVKAAREAKGWTQEDLATRCGVGKAQISKIERDIRVCPTFYTHGSSAI
jgi:transcriptional regulator with XRE-family HTH domain